MSTGKDFTFFKESFNNSKGPTRDRKSKGRQCNGPKGQNTICNDLQNTTQKTTDLVTPTPIKSGVIWYFDPHGILSTGQCLPMVN